MKALIIILSTLVLAGCLHIPVKPDVTITPKVVPLDPQVLKPCLPLNTLPPMSNPEEYEIVLMTNIISNIEIYRDCASKQDVSIQLLRKFSNKEIPNPKPENLK